VRVAFDPDAWDDMAFWLKTDPRMLKRIMRLIDEAVREPGEGTGKPERLSGNFSGAWSRRIDREHRLVYLVAGETLVILQARFHYTS
jgi:toxin YoeB